MSWNRTHDNEFFVPDRYAMAKDAKGHGSEKRGDGGNDKLAGNLYRSGRRQPNVSTEHDDAKQQLRTYYGWLIDAIQKSKTDPAEREGLAQTLRQYRKTDTGKQFLTRAKGALKTLGIKMDEDGERGDVADAPDHMPRSMASRCMSCGVDMSVRDLKDDPNGMSCSSCAKEATKKAAIEMSMHPSRPGSAKSVDAESIEADESDGVEMWNVPGTNAGGGLRPQVPSTQPSVAMDKDAEGHGSFPHSHQSDFHQRVSAMPGIMDVTTVAPTRGGLRYKTLDSHASHAIGIAARRAGHRDISKTDMRTGHYIVNVTTSSKR